MKITAYFLGLALTAGMVAGCAGILESMAGSIAGNSAFYVVFKHLSDPVSTSRTYELPADRMVQEVRSVLRSRGFTVVERRAESEDLSRRTPRHAKKRRRS